MTMSRLFEIMGIGPDATGHGEKWISGAGGLAAIFSTLWVSMQYLDPLGAGLMVASMGASAVLLFAVPHGALSQPWQLVGGHLVSALIGVSCARYMPSHLIAAPLAVGAAITAMYYLRCLHPPGGASALSAVIGGASVHQLGYQYVLTPVMLNVAVMLLIALVWNSLFPWRRYPACFKRSVAKAEGQSDKQCQLRHVDFEFALREIGSFIDITEQDLLRIYKLAVKHATRVVPVSEPISAGNYYANGEYGEGWSVRKVLRLSDVSHGNETLDYRVVAGEGEGVETTVTLSEFTAWQRYEVIPVEGSWHRIMQQ